jgi:hypothetical protein
MVNLNELFLNRLLSLAVQNWERSYFNEPQKPRAGLSIMGL